MTLYQETTPTASGLTHAVDILAFVEAQEIPSTYFETPYYLAPAPGGEKDYALLRETLRRTRKIGIAYVVIQARQHLAALIPHGQSIVLNTLRWNSESRDAGAPNLARLSGLALLSDAALSSPLRAGTATPLQHMHVTGCNDMEVDGLDELLEEALFDNEELFTALLRPRLHTPIPHAGRSNTAFPEPGRTARPRRVVRRA